MGGSGLNVSRYTLSCFLGVLWDLEQVITRAKDKGVGALIC